MMKILDYWFYKSYKLFFPKRRKSGDPIFEALALMTFTTVSYIAAILDLGGISYRGPNFRVKVFSIFFAIILVYYLVIIRNKRHHKILERFEKESLFKKILGYILLLILNIVPWVIFVIYKPK